MIIKGIFCKNIWSKVKGLMFSKPKILIFVFNKNTRINLHTFFVFFTIHVYFLDEFKRVIEIKEDFKPFRAYTSKNKAKYIIESPKKIALRLNDIIKLQ